MLNIEDFYSQFQRQVFNVNSYNEDGSVNVTLRLDNKVYDGILTPQPTVDDLIKENTLLKEKLNNLLGPSLNNS